jgi:hypothetical protein
MGITDVGAHTPPLLTVAVAIAIPAISLASQCITRSLRQ